MQKNNKGFGVAGILITVLVVAVIAVSGWLIWHKNHTPKTTNTNSNSQTTTPGFSQAEQQKQIEDAYFHAYEPEYGKVTLNVDWASLKPSGVAGYETIYVNGGDARDLYYRKDGGEWQLGMPVQATPKCDSIKRDAEIQKGLAAEACHDDSTNQDTTFGHYYSLD